MRIEHNKKATLALALLKDAWICLKVLADAMKMLKIALSALSLNLRKINMGI